MIIPQNTLPTLKVDFSTEVPFFYKNRQVTGYRGDSVATALYRIGVRIFSRSLKYHRPRGLYSLDGECSNTCMAVDDIPNERCETLLVKNDMQVAEQNVIGSARNDLLGFMDYMDWAMPAGFYYDTLHKPPKIWPLAMKQIRKTAGLGTLDPKFTCTHQCDEKHINTDVCVVGGGIAGMYAALAAADVGLRVVILEARPWMGGKAAYQTVKGLDGKPLYQKAQELEIQVKQHRKIRMWTKTSAVGAYNNLITAVRQGSEQDVFDQRYLEISIRSLVVATGCIERPLIFKNNDRPGVMQVGCAHRLLNTYGIVPGSKAVFSIGHDNGLEAAIDLHDNGMDIACITDVREKGQDETLVNEIRSRRIPFFPAWVSLEALGRKSVSGAVVGSIDGAIHQKYHCDIIVASAGLTPLTGLLTINQVKLAYDDHTGFYLPETLPANIHLAGGIKGLYHDKSIRTDGRLAGLTAAQDCSRQVPQAITDLTTELEKLPGPVRGSKFVTAPVSGRKSFICFDEDVTIKHICQAISRGFDIPELIKRFTSAGTGPGQAGIPGHNLPMFVAGQRGVSFANCLPTHTRPPLSPVRLSVYAGSHQVMTKRTPMHDRQKRDGGIFRRLGDWKRARYFSSDVSCEAEIRNVRKNVGMLDASTLGKFRIHGPDSLKALQRVYISDISKARQGKALYSAMCNEDGCVIDDGVVTKLDENDYYFTTSTGRSGVTAEWIWYHTRYDNWNFNLVNLTDALGVINLAGPKARQVLSKVVDQDISPDLLPFSGTGIYSICNDIEVRLMRLGFVGELSFEIHVPASFMETVWEIIIEAGTPYGIQNFGVETQNVLRLEKGHLILGQESEQRTTLLDLGLGFLWCSTMPEAKKVGSVALHQTASQTDRLTLVGIKTKDSSQVPGDGCIIVHDQDIKGYVCTVRKSISLGSIVGMALVDASLANPGTHLSIYQEGGMGKVIQARVTAMPFYDPEGIRMKS